MQGSDLGVVRGDTRSLDDGSDGISKSPPVIG